MIGLLRKILCPYCFRKFTPLELKFRCISETCTAEVDLELAKYMEVSSFMALPVVSAPPLSRMDCYRGWGPYKANCHKCKQETNKIICPHCHNLLPDNFPEERSFSIAIVGAATSGKSNFIGVLVNELQKKVMPELGGCLRIKTETTRERYKEKFYKKLFVDAEAAAVDKTMTADKDVRNPMFFRIEMRKKSFLFWSVIPGANLVFFDTAGDALRLVDKVSILARYIAYADGIIFVLDPLQIESVRSITNGKANLPTTVEDQFAVFERIIDLIRQVNGLSGNQPINIPMAISVSKIDALREVIKDSSYIFTKHVFDGCLDENHIECQDEELITYMKDEWDIDNFVALVKNHFPTNKFFAFSALGDIPDKSNRLKRGVSGLNVEIPLLWILRQKKLIKF